MKQTLFSFVLFVILLVSCGRKLPEPAGSGGIPDIFPDYTNISIPVNIAPLNFRTNSKSPAIVMLSYKENELYIQSRKGSFSFPLKAWRRLLHKARGDSIKVTLFEKQPEGWRCYTPFHWHIKSDPIDSHLVYRRIAPGYRMWNEMGIYQRNLEDFDEETIITNRLTHNSCINCHTFCMQSPDSMLFHQRASHAGTYMATKNKVEMLYVENADDFATPVYPYWHPSGQFIAFSSNSTKQDFHLSDPNRIEVFDMASDIMIYDKEKSVLFSDSILSSKDHLETFPCFSPDGSQLYFCSAPAGQMPQLFQEMKYSLVRVAFDAHTRTFGNILDTLYHAGREGRSAKFPRISPDGKYLMFTVSDYGNFSIWHRDADLRLMNLITHEVDSLPFVNSRDVDSYHSWSSNSRWFVFSSRRTDGLYTRPYICYIDENGKTGKPFLLPQKNTDYYDNSLFSFNIPEFVTGKVNVSAYRIAQLSLKQ